MSEGFRFDRAEPNPQELAQTAADAGRILLPLRCECGSETLVNIKGFMHLDDMMTMMVSELKWSFYTTYVPKVDHVAIRPRCPHCTLRKSEEN